MAKSTITTPNLRVLIRLASIAVAARELMPPRGHEVDAVALKALLDDDEVVAYLRLLDAASLLPRLL